MREHDSIWNKIPSGYGLAGGMVVPINWKNKYDTDRKSKGL